MNWISIKDKLPEYDKRVLISTLGDGICTAKLTIRNFTPPKLCFEGNPEGCCCSPTFELYETIYWSELPDSPKDER